jgi:hypothetical protein
MREDRMAFAAKTFRYIRPENAEITTFTSGRIRLGPEVSDELATTGDVQEIKRSLVRQGHLPEDAARLAREAVDFYTLGADCLWVSIAQDHLWWTFTHPQVIWVSHDLVPTGDRVRVPIGGWRKTNVRGKPLKLETLSSRMLQLPDVEGDLHPEMLRELLQLIRGEKTTNGDADREAHPALEAGDHLVEVPWKLFTLGDVLSKPSAAPDEPGIYAWWFDDLPNVPLDDAVEQDGFRLAYIGIASYREGSRRTLRQRLRNHCKGHIATSTLRRSLAATLIDRLDLHPFVEAGKIKLPDSEETKLSDWLECHGRVAWIPNNTPWLYETELLEDGPPLALNIKGNDHPFVHKLLSLRKQLSSSHAAKPI